MGGSKKGLFRNTAADQKKGKPDPCGCGWVRGWQEADLVIYYDMIKYYQIYLSLLTIVYDFGPMFLLCRPLGLASVASCSRYCCCCCCHCCVGVVGIVGIVVVVVVVVVVAVAVAVGVVLIVVAVVGSWWLYAVVVAHCPFGSLWHSAEFSRIESEWLKGNPIRMNKLE